MQGAGRWWRCWRALIDMAFVDGGLAGLGLARRGAPWRQGWVEERAGDGFFTSVTDHLHKVGSQT